MAEYQINTPMVECAGCHGQRGEIPPGEWSRLMIFVVSDAEGLVVWCGRCHRPVAPIRLGRDHPFWGNINGTQKGQAN